MVNNWCKLSSSTDHKNGEWNFYFWPLQSTCFKTYIRIFSAVPKPYHKVDQITLKTIIHFCGPLITSLTIQVISPLVGFSWQPSHISGRLVIYFKFMIVFLVYIKGSSFPILSSSRATWWRLSMSGDNFLIKSGLQVDWIRNHMRMIYRFSKALSCWCFCPNMNYCHAWDFHTPLLWKTLLDV